MALVGELVFIFLADYIKHGQSLLNVYFVVSYLLMAVLQVSIAAERERDQYEKVKGKEINGVCARR